MRHYNDHKKLPQLGIKDRNKLLVNWISKSWNYIDNIMIKNSFNSCGYAIPDVEKSKWYKYYEI